MRDEKPPVPSVITPRTESHVPEKAWHSSGRIVCGGCGSDKVGLDWMIFDIEASSGPRDHTFSYKPTVTRGFLLCVECYMSPAAGILRNAVSDTYSVPSPEIHTCITLCRKPRRDLLGVRRRITRRWTKCPACHRNARVFTIGVDDTPRTRSELAAISNV